MFLLEMEVMKMESFDTDFEYDEWFETKQQEELLRNFNCYFDHERGVMVYE